jgi:hypothetical protein
MASYTAGGKKAGENSTTSEWLNFIQLRKTEEQPTSLIKEEPRKILDPRALKVQMHSQHQSIYIL